MGKLALVAICEDMFSTCCCKVWICVRKAASSASDELLGWSRGVLVCEPGSGVFDAEFAVLSSVSEDEEELM